MGEVIRLRVAASENTMRVREAVGSLAVEAVSPRVSFTKVSGGTRLDITDIDGTKSTVLPDGATGPQGPAGPQGETGATGATGASGRDGADGAPGRDGVSPTASVTQTLTGATVTVTDASGTTTATLTNGADGSDGSDGVSPTVSASEITGGHRITIVDAAGTTTVDVMDGADGQTGPSGSDGSDGADGVTFTPSVSIDGVISWTNDGGKTNPQSVNIRGPQGETGQTGPAGQDGDDYVLTSADKKEISTLVLVPDTVSWSVGRTDKFINYTTGDVASSTAYNTTNFIDVSGYDCIRYKRTKAGVATSNAGMAFYDANQDFIANSGIQTMVGQDTLGYYGLYDVPVPQGAKYARFTIIADTQTYGSFELYAITRALYDLGQKQDKLTFDTAPASGSTNPVTSGGVYTAVSAKADPVVVETVSGTTPAITGTANHRYVCGECSTLSITAPASGIIDVVFESGSTPTVLTVTPPSGKTMKWPGWFDPTSLDASTTYEINIMDGNLGTVMVWT